MMPSNFLYVQDRIETDLIKVRLKPRNVRVGDTVWVQRCVDVWYAPLRVAPFTLENGRTVWNHRQWQWVPRTVKAIVWEREAFAYKLVLEGDHLGAYASNGTMTASYRLSEAAQVAA